jgi:hypothetical protein
MVLVPIAGTVGRRYFRSISASSPNTTARAALSSSRSISSSPIALLQEIPAAADKARITGVSAVSDFETNATRRRGGDEYDPAVIRNPRSLERSSRLPAGEIKHHHRLILTHVLGHVLDRGTSLVRYLFDLT